MFPLSRSRWLVRRRGVVVANHLKIFGLENVLFGERVRVEARLAQRSNEPRERAVHVIAGVFSRPPQRVRDLVKRGLLAAQVHLVGDVQHTFSCGGLIATVEVWTWPKSPAAVAASPGRRHEAGELGDR